MTEDSLLDIESRLGIRLPESFRELHLHHADRLRTLDWSGEALTPLFLTAEHVIAPNIEERRAQMGTACAFPNWWKSFVMIGTNGGGDYYSLRLDNTEGVWLIGSDCAESPTLVEDTLLEYVETTIADHAAAQALKAERARKQASFQREIDAHLAAMVHDRVPPFAKEWMTTEAIWPMFQWLAQLERKVSPRKLRFYGLALCRLIPGLENDDDCAAGLALAKAMTLGTATEPNISEMRSQLRSKIENLMKNYRSFDTEVYGKCLWSTKSVYFLYQDDDAYLSNAPIYPNDPDLTMVCDAASYAITGSPYEVELAPDLLREVLGNPFRPVPILPQCRTPEVVNLAQTIFQEERFDCLPELAMVLAKAGCVDERILAHCQRPNDHVRGCWVVDAILEKV
jgi:hypothetical protein